MFVLAEEIPVVAETSKVISGDLNQQIAQLSEAIDSLISFHDNFKCPNEQEYVDKVFCFSDNQELIQINDKICCPKDKTKIECDKLGFKHGFVYESVQENNCYYDKVVNKETFSIYLEEGNVCCNTTQTVKETDDGIYYTYNVISSSVLIIENSTDSIYIDINFYKNEENEENVIKIFNFTDTFNSGCIYQINKTDTAFTNSSNCEEDSLFHKVMKKEYKKIIEEVEAKNNFLFRTFISKNSDILRAIEDMDRLENNFFNKLDKTPNLNLSNETEVTDDLNKIYTKFQETSGYEPIKTCFTKYNIKMEGYVNFVVKNSKSFLLRNGLKVEYDKKINKDTYCLTVKNDLKRRLINYYELKSSSEKFLEGWTKWFDLQDNIDSFCKECDNNNDRSGSCLICPAQQTEAYFGKLVLNSLLLPTVILVPIIKAFGGETYENLWEGFKGTISDLEDFTKASLPIEADFGLFLEITNLNDVWDLSEFNSGVTSSNECWSISWTNILDIKKFISSLGTSFTCQIKDWAGLDEDDDPVMALLKQIDKLFKIDSSQKGFEYHGEYIKSIGNVDEFVKNTCEKMYKEGYTMEDVFDLKIEKKNPDGQSIYLNFLSAYNFSVMDYTGIKNHYYLMFKIFLPYNFTPNIAEENCYIGNFYRKQTLDNFNNLRIVSDQSNLIFFDDFNNKYSISLGSYASKYDVINKNDGFCFKNISGSEYCYPRDLTFDYKDSKLVFKKGNEFEISLSSSYKIEKKTMSNNNLICIKNEIDNFYTFMGPDQLPFDENRDEYHIDNLKMYFIFYNSTGNEVLNPKGIDFSKPNRQGSVLNMYPTYFNTSIMENAFHFISDISFTRVCAWFNYDLEYLNNGIYMPSQMTLDTLKSNGGTNYPYCMNIISSPIEGANVNEGVVTQSSSSNEDSEEDEESESSSTNAVVDCSTDPTQCY